MSTAITYNGVTFQNAKYGLRFAAVYENQVHTQTIFTITVDAFFDGVGLSPAALLAKWNELQDDILVEGQTLLIRHTQTAGTTDVINASSATTIGGVKPQIIDFPFAPGKVDSQSGRYTVTFEYGEVAGGGVPPTIVKLDFTFTTDTDRNERETTTYSGVLEVSSGNSATTEFATLLTTTFALAAGFQRIRIVEVLTEDDLKMDFTIVDEEWFEALPTDIINITTGVKSIAEVDTGNNKVTVFRASVTFTGAHGTALASVESEASDAVDDLFTAAMTGTAFIIEKDTQSNPLTHSVTINATAYDNTGGPAILLNFQESVTVNQNTGIRDFPLADEAPHHRQQVHDTIEVQTVSGSAVGIDTYPAFVLPTYVQQGDIQNARLFRGTPKFNKNQTGGFEFPINWSYQLIKRQATFTDFIFTSITNLRTDPALSS